MDTCEEELLKSMGGGSNEAISKSEGKNSEVEQ